MLKRFGLAIALAAITLVPAAAHHGWGSYDAKNPISVEGSILTSQFENPHVAITVQGKDNVWTVTLAPTSRMISRGALKEMVSPGKVIVAYGYPSTRDTNEMRAERITVDGKTVEMR